VFFARKTPPHVKRARMPSRMQTLIALSGLLHPYAPKSSVSLPPQYFRQVNLWSKFCNMSTLCADHSRHQCPDEFAQSRRLGNNLFRGNQAPL
jgi:hypothetical protein